MRFSEIMADPPGFRRIERVGQRIYYLSVPEQQNQAPRKLFKITEVDSFLKEHQKAGRYLGVTASDFDFCRQKKKRKGEESEEEQQAKRSATSVEPKENDDESSTVENPKFRFNVKNLLQAGVKLDHNSILQTAGELLDDLRLRSDEPEFTPARLADLKLRLHNQETLQVKLY